MSTFANRDLRIVGRADSSRTNDLRITGQSLTQITSDLRITGTATTNVTRDLRVRGQLDSLATRDIRVTGRLSVEVAQDIRVSGTADSSVARDIRIDSTGVASTIRDIYTVGFEQNSATRDLNIFGEVAVSAAFDLRINGGLVSTSTGYDLRIAGQVPTSVSRDIRLDGAPETITTTERDIRIEGRAVEVARPDGVITNDGWTAVPGGTLWSTIDEIIPDESDFMKSPAEPVVPRVAEVSLTDVTPPLVDLYHTVRYRIGAAQLGSKVKLTVVLLQGATEIGSWEHINISTVPETFEQTLTELQASTITNYNDLRLRFIAAPLESVSRDIRIEGESTDD